MRCTLAHSGAKRPGPRIVQMNLTDANSINADWSIKLP
jgi:hypothetical protein